MEAASGGPAVAGNARCHVFLSPHFDDAVGSCGGLMAGLVKEGRVVHLVTLFAGQGEPPYSPAALALHSQWGDAPDVVSLRQQEDLAAARLLGCHAHVEDVPDAIYRRTESGRWLYPRLPDLYHPLAPEDRGLIPCFAARLRQQFSSDSRVYAPLGIGEHVDHVLTAEVGLHLQHAGYEVLFYEDFPYALDQRRYRRRLQQVREGIPCVAPCPEPQFAAKIAAFRQYASQLPSLFPDQAAMDRGLREATRRSDGSGSAPGERYWRLHGPFRRSWGPRTTGYRLRHRVTASLRHLSPALAGRGTSHSR